MRESDALRRLLRRCNLDSVISVLNFYLSCSPCTMFYLQTSHRVEECLEAILKQAEPARFAIGSIGNTTNSTAHQNTLGISWCWTTARASCNPSRVWPIFLSTCQFFSCEARLRSELSALGAWLDCFVTPDLIVICLVTWLKLKHFGTIWNHLEPVGEPALASELLGCSLAREFSANATLQVAIYIGRMAVEDASCVVDEISVLCCWWHCSLQLALLMHCERQICKDCKGDWSKEDMNPW